MMKYTKEDLKKMQSWSLERKIQVAQTRIIEWYQHWEGKVYVSFSGGKDSTVLLDLVRRIYPDVEAVFVDTGLEYPEIKEFVRTKENVTWLKPKMNFKKVIEKYGFPVISKEIADTVNGAKTIGSVRWKKINGILLDKDGKSSIYNCSKWKFLLDAPFNISPKCCDVMKKNPIKEYEKQTGKKPFIGTITNESMFRKRLWLQNGCNAFDKKNPSSQPLSFWTEQDILQYLKKFNITYSNIYGEIAEDENGKLSTTGETRTGCMFCMFGVHLEKEPNRFQRMAVTHPKQYDYCINKLGCGKVLDYIGVDYSPLPK